MKRYEYFNKEEYKMAYDEIITSSKAAVSGGTELSLVTTGEKYAWNSKFATDLTMCDKVISYGFSRSISIKFKKSDSIPSDVADVRIPVKITFTNQYGHPATTLTVVMIPANGSPVGRVLQVGELEYDITVKSATNTSEHSTIYTFDLIITDNWGTCDISVPGTFFQFFDISVVDTTGSNPSALTIIRPGSEGIKLSNDSSFVTAKKSGDYTWLSESTIDGNEHSSAKGIAVAFAGNANYSNYAGNGRLLEAFVNDGFNEGGHFVTARRDPNGWSTRLWMAYSDGKPMSNAVNVFSADYSGHADTADTATGCPKLVTSGSGMSGFSFKIDQNDVLYEINCFEVSGEPRYWKAFLFRDGSGGIHANAIAYSNDFDQATGFSFSASSNPIINISWSNVWLGFSVIKFK